MKSSFPGSASGWIRRALPLFGASLLFACNTGTQTVTLRSLEATGEVSLVCLNEVTYAGRELAACPDKEPPILSGFDDGIDGEQRSMFALVTQPNRGEVAVINLRLGVVVDEEPTVLGFNFLSVGAQPTGIVSTPGSLATFVGVAQVGATGIFAIPSSCVKPRSGNEPIRDVTTWPACRLPAAPGAMAVLVDPPRDDDKDASTPDVIRASCDGAPAPAVDPALAQRQCWADLSQEMAHPGRRKLAVTLPSLGQIAIVDAQRVLDREPGSYDPCPIEGYVTLDGNAPAQKVPQQPPPDIDATEFAACVSELGPQTASTATVHYDPAPAGLAQVDDPVTQEHVLYVADQKAPLIHVLDTADPCAIVQEPSLLPESFVTPERVVTTSKVAASQLTTDLKRYLYAIDEFDGGSVMMFDISPGSKDRTPLLRPGSAALPFEAPDRIAFDAPARDVTFALRDRVQPDPATGNASVGILCNPDPTLDPTDPAAKSRPVSDLSTGAAPANLRGIFGFVALSSGQVAVIDVDDFDAKCRRTIFRNQSTVPNFRGCADDPDIDSLPDQSTLTYTVDPANPASAPTVTNEVTCHAVETNRARSAVVFKSDIDTGVHAPALQSLPQLQSSTGAALPSDRSAEGVRSPRMLGVNFSDKDPAQVYVGTTLHAAGDRDNPLFVEPALAQENSLVLTFAEPRAYAPQENFTARYEGSLFGPNGERQTGFFTADGPTGTFTDSGGSFCNLGVEDEAVATLRGADLGLSDSRPDATTPSETERFGEQHADFVVITSDIPEEDNSWWTNQGASCGGADPNEPGAGFEFCLSALGSRASTLISASKWRELRILDAKGTSLTVEPRNATTPDAKANVNALLACCFPTAVSYEIRASSEWIVRGSLSGFRHDIIENSNGECRRSCSPLKSELDSRVLEIACESDDCARDANGEPTIGQANPGQVGCVFAADDLPDPTLGGKHSQCLYKGLTARFAIYKGQDPSARDMQFVWSQIGGFQPLVTSLVANGDANTLPTSMIFSPEQDALLVTDGSSKGLVVVDLSTLAATPFF